MRALIKPLKHGGEAHRMGSQHETLSIHDADADSGGSVRIAGKAMMNPLVVVIALQRRGGGAGTIQ